jgi:hypothetical protein
MQSCPDAIPVPTEDDLNEGMTHEWAWKGPSKDALPGTIPTLGRVLCSSDTVRLEAGGEQRAKALREAFERFAGSKVNFVQQRVDDLGTQRRSRQGRIADPARVPPSLSKYFPSVEIAVSLVSVDPSNSQAKAHAVMDEQKNRWHDTPIPLLNGKTPRQAVQDPALRPKVVHMVKQMICRGDRTGLDGRRFQDESTIARELGLTELDYPIPPKLRAIAKESIDDHEFDDDLSDTRPTSMGLPPQPLQPHEIEKRFNHVLDYFPNHEAILDAFEDDAPEVADWVLAVENDSISESEVDYLLLMAAMLWFIAYPPEYSSPGIDLERLLLSSEQAVLRLKSNRAGMKPNFDRIISQHQPALSLFFQNLLIDTSEHGLGNESFSDQATMAGMLLCKLLIDELALGSQRR